MLIILQLGQILTQNNFHDEHFAGKWEFDRKTTSMKSVLRLSQILTWNNFDDNDFAATSELDLEVERERERERERAREEREREPIRWGGGWALEGPPFNKIGNRPWISSCVFHLCIKIEDSSAAY